MRTRFRLALATLMVASVSGQRSLALEPSAAQSSDIRLMPSTTRADVTDAQMPTAADTSSASQEDPPPAAEPQDAAARQTEAETSSPPTEAVQPMPAVQQPPAPAARPSMPRMPIGIYSGAAARPVPTQEPRPVPVQSASRMQQPRRAKPFQMVGSEPTISPYLYLNTSPTNSGQMMNYLAYVRPQLNQLESTRQQQLELQQLRSQVQRLSSKTGAVQVAPMNSSARYMDTAQFYPSVGSSRVDLQACKLEYSIVSPK